MSAPLLILGCALQPPAQPLPQLPPAQLPERLLRALEMKLLAGLPGPPDLPYSPDLPDPPDFPDPPGLTHGLQNGVLTHGLHYFDR
ncbi:hypothetical protein M8J77_011144 [Diaphorina citri]|nr:hypothetical protein M8J77_011144 [Diaphorina citri]